MKIAIIWVLLRCWQFHEQSGTAGEILLLVYLVGVLIASADRQPDLGILSRLCSR